MLLFVNWFSIRIYDVYDMFDDQSISVCWAFVGRCLGSTRSTQGLQHQQREQCATDRYPGDVRSFQLIFILHSPQIKTLSHCAPTRVNVNVSDTRWHCVKTTQAMITKSLLADSRRTIVLAVKSSPRNSKEFIVREGVKWEWGRTIHNFQPISRRILETVQDVTKIAIDDL